MHKNLIVEIEALHNAITGNYVLYTEEALEDIESWTTPYNKPAILHHKDEDGHIVGRVLEAKKIASTVKSGLFALWLKARITDQNMIIGIKNGTYITTSVGVTGNHVECSICGHRIDSGYGCAHKKGKKYKGQLCYWIVKKMAAKEISFVIVPSDKYSQVVRFYDEENNVQENIHEEEETMNLEEALAKNAELEAHQSTLTAQIESAQIALQEAKEALASEIQLREGLETEMAQVRLIEKEHHIETLLTLREHLGLRALGREIFEVKDINALKESIDDLKEELSFKESQTAKENITVAPIVSVEAPVVTDLKEAQKLQNESIQINEKQSYEAPDVKSILKGLL